VYLCVCLSAAACLNYCTDPDVTWGSGRGCPLVVHYWADLQSVHGLRCYGNITRTRNVSEYMLVSARYLVKYLSSKIAITQSEANFHAKLYHLKQLLKNVHHHQMMLASFLITDEKIFTVTTTKN